MKYLLVVILLCSCAKNSIAPVAVESKSGPSKKLLIIGDSISMGYTQYVQKDLELFYQVTRVKHADGTDENAQGTTYTLANLDRWLAQAGPEDVITWNNGLWNARDPSLDPLAPGNATDLTAYQSELIQIATKLKSTGARVIFFTTTDIPASGSTFIPGRDISENTIAIQVMDSLGIEHYDLYALAIQNPKMHHTDDPIHFNTQGYSLFGEFVSDMVRADYERSN